jgi:hypothetical protein
MPNPQPNLDNLIKGRGKKPKLGHEQTTIRLTKMEKETIKFIAASFNCFYDGEGSISGLLSQIAHHRLAIVPTPSYLSPTIAIESIPQNSLSESADLDNSRNSEKID